MSDQLSLEKNEPRPVWDLVISDMEGRDRMGTEKYRTRLQTHNGRNALRDAYEEVLDLAAYLRQEIEERNTSRPTVEDSAFKVGDRVQKSIGYPWPGVVVAVFLTTAGQTRYVVECTVPEVAGALHIYSQNQIRRDTK